MKKRIIEYPFHLGDLVGGTAHLDNFQFGAYMRLLIVNIQKGGIPTEDDKRRAYARCTDKQWAKLWPLIEEKFIPIDGMLTNPRVHQKIADINAISSGARDNALKRWERDNAPAMPQDSGGNANQKPIGNTNVLPISPKKKKKVENGKRLSEWLKAEGHEALPRPWVEYAANLGWDRQRIESVARAFRRYWDSPDAKRPVKRDWDTAWSNWVDRDNQSTTAGAGRRAGYSLDAVHDQAMGDVYRTEGREDRLARLGIGADPGDG